MLKFSPKIRLSKLINVMLIKRKKKHVIILQTKVSLSFFLPNLFKLMNGWMLPNYWRGLFSHGQHPRFHFNTNCSALSRVEDWLTSSKSDYGPLIFSAAGAGLDLGSLALPDRRVPTLFIYVIRINKKAYLIFKTAQNIKTWDFFIVQVLNSKLVRYVFRSHLICFYPLDLIS